MKVILFPSSYFNLNVVDEPFQNEYNAVSKIKEFDIVLFSYDDFLSDGKLRLSKIVNEKCTAVYRGF